MAEDNIDKALPNEPRKKFNQGGRVNYNEGSPNTGEIRDRIIEIMDAEGLDFGEAFKLAMKELNREANSSND